MNNILLIGSTGYIGSRLGQHLQTFNEVQGVDIGWYGLRGVPALAMDYRDLDDYTLSHYDTIILLAGHSGVKMCHGDIQHSWRNNVSNFVGLVEKMKPHQRLIYASSGSIHGKGTSAIFSPINNYDITKYVLDLEAQRYIAQGRNIIGLRFGTVNGLSLYVRDELMINSMVVRAKQTGEVHINNKMIRRPILGIKDLCNAVSAIVGAKPQSGIYDLCSFNDRVIDIAQDVCHTMGAKLIEHADLAGVYDFEIDSRPFCEQFNFAFQETRQSIINTLLSVPDFEHGNRNEVKEYT